MAAGIRRQHVELAIPVHVRRGGPVASGFIAGESLMGILVAVLIAFGVLTK